MDKTQQHNPLHTLHRTIQQNIHPNVEPILTNNPSQPKHQKGEQSCCSLNSNSTPLLFQISKNKYHYVRAVQRNFFIVHPIPPKAALAPNTQKYTKMENEIMRIESTTIRHRTGNRQSNIPIDKKDILAIETGSTQYDNWMTIWYEVKT